MNVYEKCQKNMSQKGDKLMKLWEMSSPSKKPRNSLFPPPKHVKNIKNIEFLVRTGPDRIGKPWKIVVGGQPQDVLKNWWVCPPPLAESIKSG